MGQLFIIRVRKIHNLKHTDITQRVVWSLDNSHLQMITIGFDSHYMTYTPLHRHQVSHPGKEGAWMVLQEEELVWWLRLKSAVTSASLISDPAGTLGLRARVQGKFVWPGVVDQRGRRSQQRGHLHHLQPDNHRLQIVFVWRLKNCNCESYLLNITIRHWLSEAWDFIFPFAVGKLFLRAILVDLLKFLCDFQFHTSLFHAMIYDFLLITSWTNAKCLTRLILSLLTLAQTGQEKGLDEGSRA